MGKDSTPSPQPSLGLTNESGSEATTSTTETSQAQAAAPTFVTLTQEQFEALLRGQQPTASGPTMEQLETLMKGLQPAAATLPVSTEQNELKLHKTLVEVYGLDYVTTQKQMGKSDQFITQYWKKEAWDAQEDDKDKDGKPLGTKGGHKKVVKIPDFLKNLPNGGVGTPATSVV